MPGWFEGSAPFFDFQKRGGALSIINGFGIDGLITFMANSNYISLRAVEVNFYFIWGLFYICDQLLQQQWS